MLSFATSHFDALQTIIFADSFSFLLHRYFTPDIDEFSSFRRRYFSLSIASFQSCAFRHFFRHICHAR